MRIAANRGPSYNVAQLASLFSVCGLALDGVDEYGEEIQRIALQDIKHVLEWGAVLSVDICQEVERLEAKASRS